MADQTHMLNMAGAITLLWGLLLRHLHWLVFLTAILVVLRHIWLTVFSRRAQLLKQFPCVPFWNIPLLYHTYKFGGNETKVTQLLQEIVWKYGKGEKMVYMWHFGIPHLLIADPNVAERILMSKVHIEKAYGYAWIFKKIAKGLLSSPGEKWRHDRKLFDPAFNRGLFERFIDIFDREAMEMVHNLGSVFEKEPSTPRSIHMEVIDATVNMVFESSLGLVLKPLVKKGDLVKALLTITDSHHLKMFKPYLYVVPFLYRLLGKEKDEQDALDLAFRLSGMALNRKRESIEHDMSECDGGTGRRKMKPFLDILVESLTNISQDEYKQHLLTIAGAAGETTATSICVTLFQLAVNPVHQEKCHKEIDAILGRNGNSRPLTAEGLTKVKYLEMCWKEALRLSSPVPMIGRRICEDVVLDDGRMIPKGVDCMIGIYHIHHDPHFYPNQDLFDPLRFLPEAVVLRPPGHYLPFSLGIRNCIGFKFAHLEAMVILIRILSRFTVQSEQNAKDLQMVFGVPSKPHKALLLRLVPRSNLT